MGSAALKQAGLAARMESSVPPLFRDAQSIQKEPISSAWLFRSFKPSVMAPCAMGSAALKQAGLAARMESSVPPHFRDAQSIRRKMS
jgi:hypothetical protein